MKQRIEATHFIEQYNTNDGHEEWLTPRQVYTPINSIKYLNHYLDETKRLPFMHTVVIWKIKYKERLTLSTNEVK